LAPPSTRPRKTLTRVDTTGDTSPETGLNLLRRPLLDAMGGATLLKPIAVAACFMTGSTEIGHFLAICLPKQCETY
jgi:hypothetical protein